MKVCVDNSTILHYEYTDIVSDVIYDRSSATVFRPYSTNTFAVQHFAYKSDIMSFSKLTFIHCICIIDDIYNRIQCIIFSLLFQALMRLIETWLT